MKLRAGILTAAVLAPLLALAGLAYLGAFTRLHADDFCIAASMVRLGFWDSVSQWYNGWAGRFSYLAASNLIGTTGPGGAAIFPAIIMAAWLLALAWGLAPLVRRANLLHPRRLALAASGLILLILFSTTPNLFQSVFWRDGQINYTFPMIGLTLLGGVILRAWWEPSWPAAVYIPICFILAFISGGYAEIFDATQAALLTLVFVLAMILSGKENRRRLAPVMGAALAGAVLALVIVVAAPGSQVRQGAIGHGAGFLMMIPFSLRNAVYIFGKYLLWNPGWALLSILAPFLSGWYLDTGAVGSHDHLSLGSLWSQPWLRGLILLPLSAYLLAAAACAPSAYAMNAYPDDRSILVPQGLLILAAVISSYLLGAGLRRLGLLPDLAARPKLSRVLPAAILVMIMVGSGFSIWQSAQQAPDFLSYARSWDQRSAVLLNARRRGQSEITVYGLTNRFGISDLEAAPDYWVNKCMADYYGFSTIRGK